MDATFGSEVVYNDASTANQTSCEIDTDKVFVAYKDAGNSNYGTGIVGTVSGTVISYGGSEAVFSETDAVTYLSCCKIGTNKVLIIYDNDTDNKGYGIVATISGTTITYGTAVEFNAVAVKYLSCARVEDDKALVSYSDAGADDYGASRVASISTTTVSFGTETVFNSAFSAHISSALFDTNKVLVGYRDGGNSHYGYAIVGTVSGTGVSFGTSVEFAGRATDEISISKLDTDKCLIAYGDGGSNGYSRVASISLTVPSYGTELNINNAYSAYITNTAYNNTYAIISYRDQGNSEKGTSIVLEIDDTSISKGNEVVFNDASTNSLTSCLISSGKAFISFQDGGNSNKGTSIIAEVEVQTEFTITISETITTTEVLARPVNYNKSFAETFSITEVLEVCKAKIIDVSETIGLTETLNKASAYAKTFSETFSITEALTASQKYLLNLVESISITESLAKLMAYSRSKVESFSITDTLSFVDKYWKELTKHTSSYTGISKHTSSWTNKNKS